MQEESKNAAFYEKYGFSAFSFPPRSKKSNFDAVDFFRPFAIMKVDICREQSRTGAARECMLLDIQGGVQYGADNIQRADGGGAQAAV